MRLKYHYGVQNGTPLVLTSARYIHFKTPQSMAWARHDKCESDMATLCKSNGKDTF